MKKNQAMIVLKSVTNADAEFLFNLLEERDSTANISHKKMPTYNSHIKFIKSKPYSKWYIILKSKQTILLPGLNYFNYFNYFKKILLKHCKATYHLHRRILQLQYLALQEQRIVQVH